MFVDKRDMSTEDLQKWLKSWDDRSYGREQNSNLSDRGRSDAD